MASPNDKHRVAVEIYGTQYKLIGTASKDYMRNVAEIVDDRMRSIANANSRLDTTRIAVLSAVHIAEQVQQIRDEHARVSLSLQKLEIENHHLTEQAKETEQRIQLLTAREAEENQKLQHVAERLQIVQGEKQELEVAYVSIQRAHNEAAAAVSEARRQIDEVQSRCMQLEAEQQLSASKLEQYEYEQSCTSEDAFTKLKDEYTKLKAEYTKLEDEYAKLQCEFSEWLELIEQDIK